MKKLFISKETGFVLALGCCAYLLFLFKASADEFSYTDPLQEEQQMTLHEVVQYFWPEGLLFCLLSGLFGLWVLLRMKNRNTSKRTIKEVVSLSLLMVFFGLLGPIMFGPPAIITFIFLVYVAFKLVASFSLQEQAYQVAKQKVSRKKVRHHPSYIVNRRAVPKVSRGTNRSQ